MKSPQIGLGTLFEIHDEQSGDEAAIRELNRRTFGGDEESRIVDALRTNDAVLISLVATLNGAIVGHILYRPVSLGGEVAGAARASPGWRGTAKSFPVCRSEFTAACVQR